MQHIKSVSYNVEWYAPCTIQYTSNISNFSTGAGSHQTSNSHSQHQQSSALSQERVHFAAPLPLSTAVRFIHVVISIPTSSPAGLDPWCIEIRASLLTPVTFQSPSSSHEYLHPLRLYIQFFHSLFSLYIHFAYSFDVHTLCRPEDPAALHTILWATVSGMRTMRLNGENCRTGTIKEIDVRDYKLWVGEAHHGHPLLEAKYYS